MNTNKLLLISVMKAKNPNIYICCTFLTCDPLKVQQFSDMKYVEQEKQNSEAQTKKEALEAAQLAEAQKKQPEATETIHKIGALGPSEGHGKQNIEEVVDTRLPG